LNVHNSNELSFAASILKVLLAIYPIYTELLALY
jgi:hypothetical protein